MKILIQCLKRLTYLLPYIFVYISSLYQPKDPDLGWHLRYGEYFFQHHQILRNNIFSTMMPNYHWANGSWGTDLITNFLYNHWGFFGLTLASALIVTLTFFFFSKAAKLTFFEQALSFPIFIYLQIPINNLSFRSQQFSFLFLGLIFFILSRYKSFSRTILFIPIVFLIWVNIHAESFLGLVLFGLWIGFVIIKNFFENLNNNHRLIYKETMFLTVSFILSLFATSINPFGINIPIFALSHFNNSLLQNIYEYAPFVTYSESWFNLIIVVIFIFLSLIYLLFKKKLITMLPVWGIPFILIIFSLFVRRYAWPAYYLLFFFFHLFGQIIESYLKKYLYIVAVIISMVSIAFTVMSKIPINQFAAMSWDNYCNIQITQCSPGSAEFLREHSLSKNLFSYYDWGGWLIWNYPDIKPTIDGRMSVWEDHTGYSAVADYKDYLTAKKSIDNSDYDTVYLPKNRSPLHFELSNLIKENKWKLAYRDNKSEIIIRIKK
jgi:hypothetical protein